MIAYLDTSGLVKLYVEEDGSDEVRALLAPADAVATAAVACAEGRAAFARLYRERALSRREFRSVREAFTGDWERLVVVQVTQPLCRLAGDLAERHRLRGFDAVHLAAFVTLTENGTEEIIFSSADRALNRAADAERRRLERRRRA